MLRRSLKSKVLDQSELLLQFKAAYLSERDFVRSSIYGMTNSGNIDDLVQETFLRAWKSYKYFKNDSSFRTWIYRIAMNVTYDYLKKEKKIINYEEVQISIKKEEGFEKLDLIKKAIAKLPLNLREAFLLHYYIGSTYLEVSELLGIPEGTVKSRCSSAKNIFVEFLKKNGGIDE